MSPDGARRVESENVQIESCRKAAKIQICLLTF